MIKQEEIREKLAQQLFWDAYLFNPVHGAGWDNIKESDRGGFRNRADRLLFWFHLQGVVLKVKDRELIMHKARQMGVVQLMKLLEEANFAAVEPLIKVE